MRTRVKVPHGSLNGGHTTLLLNSVGRTGCGLLKVSYTWPISSIGRALPCQGRGSGIETRIGRSFTSGERFGKPSRKVGYHPFTLAPKRAMIVRWLRNHGFNTPEIGIVHQALMFGAFLRAALPLVLPVCEPILKV